LQQKQRPVGWLLVLADSMSAPRPTDQPFGDFRAVAVLQRYKYFIFFPTMTPIDK